MDSWGTTDSYVELDADDEDREESDVERVELDPLAGPDGGNKSRRLARHFLDQIKKFDTEHKRWRKRCQSIEKRYQDQRAASDEDGTKRANYLWSNTQTLFPAIYGKCPTPIAERRFKDPDPVGRTAATIIERCLRNDIDGTGFHDAVGDAVFDYLLPGRGVTWVRFEPEFGPSISIPTFSRNDLRDEEGQIEDEDDTEEEEKLEDTESALIRESAPVDYVNWDDFGYLPAKARRWSEVRKVFKRVYPSRGEMVGRWGEQIGKRIPLQRSEKERRDNSGESRATRDERDDKGEVFEIWDKDTLSVYWVATGYDWLVDRKDDFLELEGFFPCPRPIMLKMPNSTLVPTPLFSQYQDQAKQIDELTQRISLLTKSVKIAGLYDGSEDAFMRLLDESVENELLPSDQWRRFMDKVKETGGLGPVWFMPIEQQIKALEVLVDLKQKVVEEMDRITGLTDIMRGVTTDGRETLGGEKLKNRNGKSRLREYQDEVARFARDTLVIKAEVICKHFRKKTIVEMSGALYDEGLGFSDIQNFLASGALDGGDSPPPPQLPPPPGPPSAPPGTTGVASPPPMAGPPGAGPGGPPLPPAISPYQKLVNAVLKINAAIDLLRDDITRGFRVDIETDSTIVADEEQDRADATEFIATVEKFLETATQLGAANPDMVPLLGKLLQFGVRRFRVGRDLEATIDEFVDKAEQQAKQRALAPPPPNPEMVKAKADEIRAQADVQKAQAELQNMGQDAQNEKVKAAAEIQKQRMQDQAEQLNAQHEKSIKAIELKMKEMDLQLKQMELTMKAHQTEATVNADHVEVGGKRTHINDALGQMGEQHKTSQAELSKMLADGHKQLLDHIKAPRRVVRDANGRVAGVVVDTMGPAQGNA